MSIGIKLYQTKRGIIAEQGNQFFQLTGSWQNIVNRKNLHGYMDQALLSAPPLPAKDFNATEIEAPLDHQEVWAAGVTYQRSKSARMDESKKSGASVFYDMVYEAERPEIFFKATPHRVVGPGQPVRIRKDSIWNVPEPELTLFISSHKTIEGYTIGNDMSSRSIEGENPLYLPQAKSYDGCAALGPCLYVPEQLISPDTGIYLIIERNGQEIFKGEASLKQMKRSLLELANWLTRECSFPNGVYLMTGTCLVPENNFTLQPHDRITMAIDGIGILSNTVAAE
jgi:2-dehydro-3-deoxy-D-arabinonate dehydratase